MSATPISQLEKATAIPSGSLYLIEMGDGSGTKTVTQETMAKETGKALKVGNLEELQTENKGSLVGAINEAAQSGGSGSNVDILDTKEEIEANTESGKVAGALAVKEMFGELNDNLGGCSLTQEGEDFYIVGADAVRKKLGSANVSLFHTFFHTGGVVTYTFTKTVQHGVIVSSGNGSVGDNFGFIIENTGSIHITTLVEKSSNAAHCISAYEFVNASIGDTIKFQLSGGGGGAIIALND